MSYRTSYKTSYRTSYRTSHGRFPAQTPLVAWTGLGTQPHYEAPGNPRSKSLKRSDEHRVSETVPSIMS